MALPLLAIASTALQAYNTFKGSGKTAEGAVDQNTFNAEQAQMNRDFQERMYKNRHTYEVEDLERAGLNKILSANSASSAPPGAQAQGVNTQTDENAQRLQRQQLMANIASTAADVFLKKKLGEKAETEAELNRGNAGIPGLLKVPLSSASQWIHSKAQKYYGKAPQAFQIAKDYLKTGSFASQT